MNPLETYGLNGVLIIAVAALWIVVQKQIKDHKEERDEQDKLHREEREKLYGTIEKQFEESNRNTRESVNVLSGLKTLLENRK